jgi:uncharacterized protein
MPRRVIPEGSAIPAEHSAMEPAIPQVEDVLQFPCDHIFKAFGPNDEDGRFQAAVLAAVCSVQPVPLDAVRPRPSAQGAYLCVSVVVRLESFVQLQANYAALRAVPDLKYLL